MKFALNKVFSETKIGDLRKVVDKLFLLPKQVNWLQTNWPAVSRFVVDQ